MCQLLSDDSLFMSATKEIFKLTTLAPVLRNPSACATTINPSLG
jgi:hypothetical protein